jgi:hypothetical protein
MKQSNRRTAPGVSKKAPAAGPGSKKPVRSRAARDIHSAASRDEVRAVNRRVTPSRQSNRRGRSAAGK